MSVPPQVTLSSPARCPGRPACLRHQIHTAHLVTCCQSSVQPTQILSHCFPSPLRCTHQYIKLVLPCSPSDRSSFTTTCCRGSSALIDAVYSAPSSWSSTQVRVRFVSCRGYTMCCVFLPLCSLSPRRCLHPSSPSGLAYPRHTLWRRPQPPRSESACPVPLMFLFFIISQHAVGAPSTMGLPVRVLWNQCSNTAQRPSEGWT